MNKPKNHAEQVSNSQTVVTSAKGSSEDALSQSYRNLRVAFTKKCQELSELKRQLLSNHTDKENSPDWKEQMPTAACANIQTQNNGEQAQVKSNSNPLCPPPHLMGQGGANPACQAKQPKTLQEAGEMARKVLVIR